MKLKIVRDEASVTFCTDDLNIKEILQKLNLEVYELPDTEDTVSQEG